MNITVKTRHMEVSEAMRDYVESKVARKLGINTTNKSQYKHHFSVESVFQKSHKSTVIGTGNFFQLNYQTILFSNDKIFTG